MIGRLRSVFPAVALLLASPGLGQDEAQREWPGHSEIGAMFRADQAVRSSPIEDWAPVLEQDRRHRERVRELLDENALQTAADFYAAAFIFQHGETPEDYLLAHVLATRAIALGMDGAEWIAAATLDRFLHSIDQPQVYGTQYVTRLGDGVATQAPYAPELLTDGIREGAGVRTLEQQADRIAELSATTPQRD